MILRHHHGDNGTDEDYDCDAKRSQIKKAGGLNSAPNRTAFLNAMATFSWWAAVKDTNVAEPGETPLKFKDLAWFCIQEWFKK